MKTILNFFKNLFRIEREEVKEIMYAVVEPMDILQDYAIPEDYLYDYFYVIKYYKNGRLIGMEPFSKTRVDELEKIMPVVWKGLRVRTSKFIDESMLRFEL